MKKRKKHILSRSGISYRVILDNENKQVEITWLLRNNIRINRRKREFQDILNLKGLNLDMLKDEPKSVTYSCPVYYQKTILRILRKL